MAITSANLTGDSNVIAASGSLLLLNATYFTGNNNYTSNITLNGTTFTVESLVAATGQQLSTTSFTSGGLTYSWAPTGSNVVSADNGFATLGGSTWWSGLSSGMQHLLTSGIYSTASGVGPNASGGGGMTFEISGLTSGASYTVEFIGNVGLRGPGWTQTVSADGSSAAGNVGTQGSGATTSTYYTANFTASGSTETFTFVGSVAEPEISAFEVLQAVPEPSTVALISVAFGMIGLVAVRRFRAVQVSC